MCRQGAREVQEKVLALLPSDNLKVFVVWTPRYPGDNRGKAVAATELVGDKRASHFWDGGRHLGTDYGKVLKLPGKRQFAWDVYLAFDARARWEKTPPVPAEWMHQLGGDERRLDGDKLREAVATLLKEAAR
jgi:hypothetical protein